jgi:hypothetical protein
MSISVDSNVSTTSVEDIKQSLDQVRAVTGVLKFITNRLHASNIHEFEMNGELQGQMDKIRHLFDEKIRQVIDQPKISRESLANICIILARKQEAVIDMQFQRLRTDIESAFSQLQEICQWFG